jgi:hypothetical protein
VKPIWFTYLVWDAVPYAACRYEQPTELSTASFICNAALTRPNSRKSAQHLSD